MERKREALEKRGIRVAAVTFDSVATLKHFADRTGIGYPLLSDEGSAVIRRFGIVNESVPTDHEWYGMAVPGEYLLTPEGVVQSKFFEENFRDRGTAGRTLVQALEGEATGKVTEISNPRFTARVWASDEVVRGGNRIALVIDLDLAEKMHVYAPGVEGYIPIDWSMDAQSGAETFDVDYPEPRTLHLPAIGETVPVYEHAFRLTRDVQLAQPDELSGLLDGDEIVLSGKLRLQACDDEVCYIPETLDLEWRLTLEEHDRTRVPEQLR